MAKSFKIFLVTGILLVLGGLAAPLQAQNRTVSGVVKDDTGEPLFGAFVVQQGTVNGISTDFEGRYTLTVPSGEVTLQFQFIGYVTQNVKVPAGKSVADVVMKTDANLMEEVVVTAFATQKKVNVTGAISSVNGGDILSTPVSNISNACWATRRESADFRPPESRDATTPPYIFVESRLTDPLRR